jgi:hypothetical protein
MPRITTQKEFAQHRQLAFCYLCGERLDNGYPLNEDHCPPRSIFAPRDRADYPVKLRVHKQCNDAWHLSDDVLSLLFDPVSGQGKAASEKHRRRMEKHKTNIDRPDCTIVGYTDLPLRPFAWRVVRCMHALLYKEALPENIAGAGHVMYPFGEASPSGRLISNDISAVSLAMSRRIASSLKASTFDYVSAYNGKFKYICCWAAYDNGKPICLFAFDLLNMAEMAYPMGGLPKAVIGHYMINPPPSEYSRATNLEIPLTTDEIQYPLPK